MYSGWSEAWREWRRSPGTVSARILPSLGTVLGAKTRLWVYSAASMPNRLPRGFILMMIFSRRIHGIRRLRRRQPTCCFWRVRSLLQVSYNHQWFPFWWLTRSMWHDLLLVPRLLGLVVWYRDGGHLSRTRTKKSSTRSSFLAIWLHQ